MLSVQNVKNVCSVWRHLFCGQKLEDTQMPVGGGEGHTGQRGKEGTLPPEMMVGGLAQTRQGGCGLPWWVE